MSETIEYEDLSGKVYQRLRSMILDGELPAGEKLRQEELSARLGVSRTPIVTAITRLSKEVLVELLPRRGARVRLLGKKEMLDLYDIRIGLEPLGAREAAASEDQEGIEDLARSLEDFRTAVEAGDLRARKKADFDFHMALMRCSGNRFLFDMLATYNIIIIANTTGLLKPAEQSDREHHELMDALEARDPDRADRIMFVHLSGARANLVQRAMPAGRPATED